MFSVFITWRGPAAARVPAAGRRPCRGARPGMRPRALAAVQVEGRRPHCRAFRAALRRRPAGRPDILAIGSRREWGRWGCDRAGKQKAARCRNDATTGRRPPFWQRALPRASSNAPAPPPIILAQARAPGAASRRRFSAKRQARRPVAAHCRTDLKRALLPYALNVCAHSTTLPDFKAPSPAGNAPGHPAAGGAAGRPLGFLRRPDATVISSSTAPERQGCAPAPQRRRAGPRQRRMPCARRPFCWARRPPPSLPAQISRDGPHPAMPSVFGRAFERLC